MENIIKIGMLLSFTAIAVVCIAAPVRAGQSSASGKPSHGGGSGGGSFYPTASTVSQLIADINYANQAGGAITINLAPGATFDLKSADNTTDGGIGLPVIGGTKAVALTIIGNGDTIKRIAVFSRKSGYTTNPFRLFDVAPGASLTLDHVTLQGAWASAILNHGTLNVINGSTLSDTQGRAIDNSGGTVTVNNSTLSPHNYGGIGNGGGTVTVSNSTLSDNGNGGGIYNNAGTVTVSHSILSGNAAYGGDPEMPTPIPTGLGGGIYNNVGTVTVENSSSITGNLSGGDVLNSGELYLDSTSTIGFLYGNSAIPF